jgi:glycine hydroxymethyltransferase
MVTSGIRLGSPAITSRGFGVDDAREVGAIIGAALDDIETRVQIERLRGRVSELSARFDVP